MKSGDNYVNALYPEKSKLICAHTYIYTYDSFWEVCVLNLRRQTDGSVMNFPFSVFYIILYEIFINPS